MAESIIQKDDSKCFICHSHRWLEWHHIFGAAYRDTSEHYGLKVRLCHYCHNEPPNGVHFNKDIRRKLQAKAQKIAMKHYKWSVEDFRERFGRNYL